MADEQSLPVAVRGHLLRLLDDLGFAALLPPDALAKGLEDFELGLGQLLADVERAHRQGVSLDVAVHSHQLFPHLARLHGILQDAFVMALPAELVPIMRRLLALPPPDWVEPALDSLCVVVRSAQATVAERAFARLVVFEQVRIALSVEAYRTNGAFEGVGGCRRDLDEIAARTMTDMLAIPLSVDAVEHYRPLTTSMVAAIVRMHEHIEQLWRVQAVVADLRQACEERQRFEILVRDADPVDAAVLRNYFDRAEHQQQIAVSQLVDEHPLILDGYNEDSLHKRCSRACEKLEKTGPRAIVRHPKPITIASLMFDEKELSDA